MRITAAQLPESPRHFSARYGQLLKGPGLETAPASTFPSAETEARRPAEKPYRLGWAEVYAGPASGCLLIVLGMPAGDGPFNSLKPLADLSHVRRQAALGSMFQD
jgi:hypothetical protein